MLKKHYHFKKVRLLSVLLVFIFLLSPINGINAFSDDKGKDLRNTEANPSKDNEINSNTNGEVVDVNNTLVIEKDEAGISTYIAKFTPEELVNKVETSMTNEVANLKNFLPGMDEKLINKVKDAYGDLYHVDTKSASDEQCLVSVFMNKDTEGNSKDIFFLMVNNTTSEREFKVDIRGYQFSNVTVPAFGQGMAKSNGSKPIKSPEVSPTQKASVSPEVSSSPDTTTPPNETIVPEESNNPEESKTPDITATPERTKDPIESKAPIKTEKPVESMVPSKIEAPVNTNAPESSKIPAKTEAPVITLVPEESIVPTITVVPTESIVPTATDNSSSEDADTVEDIKEIAKDDKEIEVVERDIKKETDGFFTLKAVEVAVHEVSIQDLVRLLADVDSEFYVSLYDYDNESLNNKIGRNRSNLLIGNTGYGPQNTWTDNDSDGKSKGVFQGIPNNDYINGDIAYSYSTNNVDLFAGNGSAIRAYENLAFPFFTKQNGYYVFDSSATRIYYNSTKKILEAGGALSGFWPFNGPNNYNKNEYFGMTFSFQFMMPKDGKVDSKDMVFEFSGDDDVWIFLKNQGGTNGKIALDLGGIHGRCSGSINFATGEIIHDSVFISSNRYKQKVKWYLYTKEDAIAHGLTDNYARYVGLDRTAYANYQLDLYFMERGGNESNCYMKFNLPTIPQKQIKVAKEVKGIIPDSDKDKNYQFKLFTSSKSNSDFVESGNFSLKDGESTSMTVDDNKYYYIQETDNGRASETNWSISGQTGQSTVGDKSNVGYTGDGGAIVTCTNKYDNQTLTIKKELDSSLSKYPTNAEFQFLVKLNNQNYNGEAYIDNISTTMKDGILKLKAGQIAQIKNLTAETKYSVTELTFSDSYYSTNLIKTVTTLTPNDNTIPASQIIQPKPGSTTVSSTLEGEMRVIPSLTKASQKEIATEVSVETSNIAKSHPSDVLLVFTNQFYVIKDGTININKFLVDTNNEPKADFDENTFIFKLTNTDLNSPGYGSICYGSIKVEAGKTTGPTFAFQNLPRGTYQLVELNHMRYRLLSITDSGVTTLSSSNRTASFKIYNNKWKDNYFSDSHSVNNSGTEFYNNNGN